MKPYHNHSGALNDPGAPDISQEQQEAIAEAESRDIESAIDESRCDS